jgi:hypothetical protein
MNSIDQTRPHLQLGRSILSRLIRRRGMTRPSDMSRLVRALPVAALLRRVVLRVGDPHGDRPWPWPWSAGTGSG